MTRAPSDLKAEALERFRAARRGMVQAILSGRDLSETLDLAANAAESLFDGCAAAVALIDTDGCTLLNGASPSLPPELSKDLHHLTLPAGGRTEGSQDPKTDPEWAPYRDRVEMRGYRVSWSQVVRDVDDTAIGYLIGMSKGDPQALVADAEARIGALSDLVAIVLHQAATRYDLETTRGQLAALVENSTAIVAIKDLEGRYLLVSKAAKEILGIRVEEMIGRDVTSVFGDQVGAFSDALRLEALAKNAPARGEVEVDGRCLEETYFPLLTPRGTPYGSGVIALDVTERKRAEERLRQAARMEIAGQLASGIAHDFNNILLGIGMSAHAGDEENVDAATLLSAFEDIRSLVARGGALTERLLMFATSGSAAPETFEVTDLLSSIAPWLKAVAGKARVEIRPTPGVPPIQAVRADLERALVNLVVNARDAVGEGGRIVVSGHLTETEPPEVVLSVTDNGHGMDAFTAERVFEPFFSTKAERGAGFGLGLAVVEGVAADAGGRVDIESEVGEGTTVSIFLPPGVG